MPWMDKQGGVARSTEANSIQMNRMAGDRTSLASGDSGLNGKEYDG